jgi:nucleolar complex protein 2
MMNCVVEMYGLDFTCSYQHMFVYLRQLAILLRTAYNNKTKASLNYKMFQVKIKKDA